jgi:hypothetical protein
MRIDARHRLQRTSLSQLNSEAQFSVGANSFGGYRALHVTKGCFKPLLNVSQNVCRQPST